MARAMRLPRLIGELMLRGGLALAVVVPTLGLTGCNPAGLRGGSDWPPVAKKWFDRAKESLAAGDVDDADIAVERALERVGDREEVRMLAAEVALARLDYERTVELLKGLDSPEALRLRARARWYSGDVAGAGKEAKALLSDPDVRDPWARDIVTLAKQGADKKPFTMSGDFGMSATPMFRPPGGRYLVVPVAVNGEAGLALVATNMPEAVIDSAGGEGPAWIELTFGRGRVTVSNVPALRQDLSGLARKLGAPIKALLGVQTLRHLNPTIDFLGNQFVVRQYEPPAPPEATRLNVAYLKGGGMLLRGSFQDGEGPPDASFLVDTSVPFPVALDDDGLKASGVARGELKPLPNAGSLKYAELPLFRVGSFRMPQVFTVHGLPTSHLEKGLGVDLDGVVGAGFLSAFRVTLAREGRTLYLEGLPEPTRPQRRGPPPSLKDQLHRPGSGVLPGQGKPGGLAPGGLQPGGGPTLGGGALGK